VLCTLVSMAMVVEPHLIRTRSDLKGAVARCSEYGAFVIDVETDGLFTKTNWVTWVGLATHGQCHLIPMGQRNGRLLKRAHSRMELPPDHLRAVLQNGQLSQRKVKVNYPAVFGDPGEQLDPAVVFEELQPLLFSDLTKIGHNVKFDLMTVSKYYDGELPPGPYEDTMIMQHIVDENRRQYDLKECVLDMMHVVGLDQRRVYYPKLGKTIMSEAIDAVSRYLAKDTYLCWLLRQHLAAALQREGLASVFRLEMDVYPAVMRMEMGGTAIDTDEMKAVGDDLHNQITVLENRCWNIAKGPFAMTDVNKKRDLLFRPQKEGGQGLRPLSVTAKTGVPQLNQFTLEHYSETNELARLFSEWSAAAKLHSTYIVGLRNRMHVRDGQEYVYTTFTQQGTVTGRLSSRDPNVQNIPTDSSIRGLFVAPDGQVLIVADYDQIELRVIAHFSQDPVMMGIFQRGEDIHAGTAAAVLGKDIEEVTPIERSKIGKPLNFAVGYGAGWQKVAAMSGSSERQAKLFVDRYYQRFAMIKPWKRRVLLDAAHRGDPKNRYQQPAFVTTLLGRKRRLPDLYSDDNALRTRAERQAINHRVQGTAAEIMKIAIIKVDRAFQGTPYRMLMTVHDELLSSVPQDEAEQAKKAVVTAMSGICFANGDPIINVPLVVSCGTAKRWSEAKA
jgi:DNA polymerase I-like protein with 3'-5' exonuclease and polymerase domains